jgi:lysylphosphatidylglycerol synthetase-like protein (DUF2156 family)
MENIQLFLVNGVFGYFLQAMGYVIAISAFAKKPMRLKYFLLCTLAFSIVTFFVRQIGSISFGFHTILIMIAFSVISIIIFKTPIYPTVLAVLLTAVAVTLSEGINYSLLSLIFDQNTVTLLIKGDGTTTGEVKRALAGIPTNIILLGIMLTIYHFRMKKLKKESKNGETGK